MFTACTIMHYQSLVGQLQRRKAMSACTSQGCWPVALEILQLGPESETLARPTTD